MAARDSAFPRRVLVIAGLSTLAVAWPILDIFGRNPEVFVANRSTPAQIVIFALVVALVVPALSTLVVWGFGQIGERHAGVAYGVVISVLSVATGLVVARQMTDRTLVALLVVVAVVELVVMANRWASGFLPLTAFALPAALILFVFASPASGLIWSEDQMVTSGRVGSPAPIVIIQMDEFPLASIVTPDGTLNAALFPNFARLAAEGTWYRNALGDSIATTQAIPALLTGRRFDRGLSPSVLDHPENLFTLLAESHEMHVIEWVASMCPGDICSDFAARAPARFASLIADAAVVYSHLAAPPGMEERLPSIDNSWRGFLGQEEIPEGDDVDVPGLPVPAPEIRADWVDWLQRIANGIARSDPPILSYAHVPAPHVPWVANPSGTHYQRPEQYTEVAGAGGDGRWAGNQAFGIIGLQRHLYQVGLLDTMLGRIFTEMDRTRTWSQSLVVVVADHGASFELGEHRRWPHENNRDDLYRIPLFVKYPGQTEGRVVDAPAFGIDVLPTIVEVLDVETDWEFDGIPLPEVEGTDRPHQPMWWCCSRLPASSDLSVLFGQVARNYRWIPDQGSWTGVAGVGEHAHLVGSSADDLMVSSTNEVQWQLELGADLLEPERPDGMVQTYLDGRVSFPVGLDPREVLFVVNGTIAGMGVVLQDGPESGTFHGVIAEEVVAAGPNQVDVLIPGTKGTWLSGTLADLSRELVTADGRILDVRPEGGRRLQVDQVTVSDGSVTLVGWGADVVAKTPPIALHVFAGARLLTWSEPNLDNGNVVVWFGSEDLLRSGFTLTIAEADVPVETAQLTVVAEFDTYAVSEVVALP